MKKRKIKKSKNVYKNNRTYINEDALGWSDETRTKSKCCRAKLYIKIFRNKANMLQIGLYCSKCQKWDKFVDENDVFYYVGCRCRVLNTYGSLYGTRLYQLKDIIELNKTR